MNHVMLDIETMGIFNDEAIISVGACYFDPETGKIGETFYEKCSLQSSIGNGLKMDAPTVLWWMSQDKEASSEFLLNENDEHINVVLINLSKFINDKCQVWANGATFDITIIRNAYKQSLCSDTPWKFWNDRDVRTIVELGERLGYKPKQTIPFEGKQHLTLDGAIHQAKYVSAIWQILTKYF